MVSQSRSRRPKSASQPTVCEMRGSYREREIAARETASLAWGNASKNVINNDDNDVIEKWATE